jgi:hypothetical protein
LHSKFIFAIEAAHIALPEKPPCRSHDLRD